ncbi:MAG: twin-arginine translocase TatA/TatE family subunit [Thermodesulfobacteriota bacterium]|nr:twin-arginine translocase TatA/TatE family subunit [Thermodesulfobacteriota bacterium]
MFGIGMPEMIIIMVIALIVIGPSKLPDLARALGKGMLEFRKATREIKESLNVDEELKDVKEDLVDSISGLDTSMDTGPPGYTAGESPESGGLDGISEAREKTNRAPQEELKEPPVTASTVEKSEDE